MKIQSLDQLLKKGRYFPYYGPKNATQIAESIAMDRSSISRLINQLKKLGYVISVPNPNDRRGVLLSLTEGGNYKTMLALKEKESIFLDRISDLSDVELKVYIKMLNESF